VALSNNLMSYNAESVETDISDWTATENCTIAQSGTQALEGTQSLRITSIASGDCKAAATPTAVLTAGVLYGGFFWCYTDEMGLTGSLGINWEDEDYAFLSNVSTPFYPLKTGEWTQIGIVSPEYAPDDTVHMNLQVTCRATAGGQLFWCDEMFFGMWVPPTAGGSLFVS
jgi:hypothetical protein